MIEGECGRVIRDSQHPFVAPPRVLTHDEKKAAEAAFRGEPFNPTWSGAAAKVYAGIVSALVKREGEATDAEALQEC
jgi:hypothetical protein